MQMIKNLGAAMLWGLVVSLQACAAGPLPSPVESVTITRAEYNFELAYNVAAKAYLVALDHGLTGERKATAKTFLANAYKAVKLARAAKAVGDAPGVELQAAAIAFLTSQALSTINGN